MRGLKYLVLVLIFFPLIPDLGCVSLYASEEVVSERIDNYLSAILFFICVLLGNRLWKVFINSFEKWAF